jgi:predicted DNA-binding transcriptional regulator AlpA
MDSRWPRGLRRDDAARYLGLSSSKFDELVGDGRMPKPKQIDGCVVWDRFSLDQAFDAIPDQGAKGGRSRWKDVKA